MTLEEKAEAFFKEGFNCAQAVFCPCAETFGIPLETAKRLASGLGGGVGRQREVRGAVTGATLAIGLKTGGDRAQVYPAVQAFCDKFKSECGSIVCRELLAGTGATTGGAPEARTPEYYRKRPCVELVKLAARLLEEGA
jgi:C_GCAxxG_C_C family probable redox protein